MCVCVFFKRERDGAIEFGIWLGLPAAAAAAAVVAILMVVLLLLMQELLCRFLG